MATPLTGDGVLALIPQGPLDSVEPSSPASGGASSSPQEPASAGGAGGCLVSSALESPILIFLFFQKAIRSELERLHRAAVALATTDRGGNVRALADRCRFLFAIYKHHCNAEDENRFQLRSFSWGELFCSREHIKLVSEPIPSTSLPAMLQENFDSIRSMLQEFQLVLQEQNGVVGLDG